MSQSISDHRWIVLMTTMANIIFFRYPTGWCMMWVLSYRHLIMFTDTLQKVTWCVLFLFVFCEKLDKSWGKTSVITSRSYSWQQWQIFFFNGTRQDLLWAWCMAWALNYRHLKCSLILWTLMPDTLDFEKLVWQSKYLR